MSGSTRGVLSALIIVMAQGVAFEAAAASKYGCFRVNVSELNLRERPYSDARVIGTAAKGDILEKRKFLCTLRGYWCAVRSATGLEGYADKSYLDKIPCP